MLSRPLALAAIWLLLSPAAHAATRVMVLPFETANAAPTLGLGAMDSLISGLSRLPDMILVDRATITTLIKEQAFQASGLVSPDSAVKLGRIMGVNAVITGRIQVVSDQVRLSALLVNAETSQVMRSEVVTGQLTEFFNLQDRLADRFATGLGVRMSPDVEARASRVMMPTANMAAFEAYQRGRSAYLSFTPGGFRDAVDAFDQALAADPAYALAHAAKAEALAHWGRYRDMNDRPPDEQYRQAQDSAEKALAMQSDLPEAWRAAALARHFRKEPGAIVAVDKALALVPQDAETHVVAWMIGGNGDPDGPELRKAISLCPRLLLAQLELGRTLQRNGRYAEAKAAFEAAIALNADAAQARVGLGRSLMKLGDLTGAEACLREASRREPTCMDAYNLLSFVKERQGDVAGAVAVLEAGERIDPYDDLIALNLGVQLHRAGRPHEALPKLERALKLSPDAVTWSEYTETLFDAGKEADALRAATTALQVAGRQTASASAWYPPYQVAMVYLQARRYAESEAASRTSLRFGPDNPHALLLLGRSLVALERPAEALEPARQAAVHLSDKAEPFAVRAYALICLRRFDEARVALAEGQQREPNNQEIRRLWLALADAVGSPQPTGK